MSQKIQVNALNAKGVDQFLSALSKIPERSKPHSARLLFALDATASRENTWREAKRLHATLFDVAAEYRGTLRVQLCYYQGMGLFERSRWLEDALALKEVMAPVNCLGGYTQIEAVLLHALKETRLEPLKAVVFIGDAIEENTDRLCHLAGQLGLLNTPLFIFQEGNDAATESAFKQMTKLSGGAWSRFDVHCAEQLEALLRTVAAFATGGLLAIKGDATASQISRSLVQQLEKKS